MTNVAGVQFIEKRTPSATSRSRPSFHLTGIVGTHGVEVGSVRSVKVIWQELPAAGNGGFVPSGLGTAWQSWFDKLERFAALRDGWNGYTAPKPNELSIRTARQFLEALQAADCEPTRVAPSAMGGVAITRRAGPRKVFVEFYNDGRVYALFSERPSEMRVAPLQADPQSFRHFTEEMRRYLDG
jgi:hypothetical protein